MIFLETPTRRWQAGERVPQDSERVNVTHRTDPACRLHEVTDQDKCERESPAPQAGGAQPEHGDATTPACEPPGEDGPPQPSLDHKVRFVTGKGLGLLFHPGPLDKWIGRDVTYEEATGRFWETPGSTSVTRWLSPMLLTGGDCEKGMPWGRPQTSWSKSRTNISPGSLTRPECIS